MLRSNDPNIRVLFTERIGAKWETYVTSSDAEGNSLLAKTGRWVQPIPSVVKMFQLGEMNQNNKALKLKFVLSEGKPRVLTESANGQVNCLVSQLISRHTRSEIVDVLQP